MSETIPNRQEFEHVKRFLLIMDSLIPAIKMKFAVVAAQHSLQTGGYRVADVEQLAGMLLLAWEKAFKTVEKFSSLSDAELMSSAVKNHFTPILRGYGLDAALTTDVMKVFESKITRMKPAGLDGWGMGEKSKSLRHHVIPNCSHTESEEMAADNFMTFSRHSAADLGAELSSVTPECVRSILAEVGRNPQIALSTREGNIAMVLLSLRGIQLGIAVPASIMAEIQSMDMSFPAEAMFHLPVEFSIDELKGDSRRQFSEILARASLSAGAEIMFTVQFPSLDEETMSKIVNAARAGAVHYI